MRALTAILFAGLAIAQAPAPKSSTPPAPLTYVGSEACQVCHEDISKAFASNPHNAVEKDKKRGWEGRSCESCHGPGSNHVENPTPETIRSPLHLPVAEADATCLGCHRNQPTHVGRIQSGHARNQVSCVSCHTVHKSAEQLVPRRRPDINAACSTCHLAERASFQRPHKHKLPEGAMSCVDCHNPHGSILARSMQTAAANEPGCLNCHGDKRGPFVFEHGPVRLEGCAACHESHGSANPRMLKRQQVSLLCLECHSNMPATALASGTLGGVPPSFHDLRNPRFQNCTNCHVKIHGSNVSRELLR